MEITYAPRGILQIDDARITHKNFAGEGSPYNREGDRNFSLIIDDRDVADKLASQGWNVKVKEYDGSDEPFIFLPVKIKFSDFGPKVYLVSGRVKRELTEETISCLDNMEIECINMDIRPYDWEVNKQKGRTAYLHSMEVIQRIDRFAARYAEDER